jgi:hypothetical protein
VFQENSAVRNGYIRSVGRKNPVLDGHSLLQSELSSVNNWIRLN